MSSKSIERNDTRNHSDKDITIHLKKVTFFQKPLLGGNLREQSSEPLQLVYPTGNLGMGLPVNSRLVDADINRTGTVALISPPEYESADISYNNSILGLLLLVALVNLILTSLLYQNASVADSSKVENFHGSEFDFGRVPINRSYKENVHFGFTILLILLGAIAGMLRSPLGLTLYSYAIVVNFVLGTQDLPYFLYSVRYLFDLFMLYLALILRTKFTPAFLPIYVQS
jgi:hypothetical protein